MGEASKWFSPEETGPNVASFPAIGTGVYPSQALEQMARARAIRSLEGIEPDQIQPASLDLRLGKKAYRIDASFLPGPARTVMEAVERRSFLEVDLSNGALLTKKAVYLVELQEAVSLPPEVYGVANPKSSTGRLDILTRLITDNAVEFDRVPEGYSGQLYIEVAPLSFDIFARQGDRLNQLRIQRGKELPVPKHKMRDLYAMGALAGGIGGVAPLRDDTLVPVRVNLRTTAADGIVAYEAKRTTAVIDLRNVNHYDPQQFWHAMRAHDGQLTLRENRFYILATCEDVGVPSSLAAEMVPYDARSGEFRVHYAGFFDPGFGTIEGRAQGSKAVLEVRSHGVPFTLEHGQIVGWLRYAPIANGSTPNKLYGTGLKSNYQGQSLRLAKQFMPWPNEPPPPMAGPDEPPFDMLPKQFL